MSNLSNEIIITKKIDFDCNCYQVSETKYGLVGSCVLKLRNTNVLDFYTTNFVYSTFKENNMWFILNKKDEVL